MKKNTLVGCAIMFSSIALHAQEPDVDVVQYTNSVITPQFFVALIAGVLLALGFQFILTALSVALGITAIGDLKEKYVHSQTEVSGDDDDDDSGTSTGKMVTTGFGLWSVITVALSLFGATALAINLGLIANTVIAITLGLVIWATFFILLFYLESKLVNTLVGGLINTATAGLRASGDAIKGIFSTSKEQQMKNVAEDTVEKISKEFSASFDTQEINKTIEEFFSNVDSSVPDYEEVRNDVKKIVKEAVETSNETKKETSGGGGGSSQGKWMAIQQVMNQAISETSKGGGDQSKTEQLKQLQKELKEAYGQGGSKEEKMEKVAAKLTSADEEEIHSYVEKIKDALTKITPDDMEKGKVQDEVMQIVKNPKVEGRHLVEKLQELDRDTIISLLSKNTALQRDQVEKYAQKIEDLLEKAKEQLSSTTGGSDSDTSDMKQKLEKEVFKLVNHTGKPEINFSMLTGFFQDKISSSGSQGGVKGLKRKLQNMDAETIKNTVTNNTFVDEKDIDKVVQSYEDAKNNVLQKIDEIEQEATRRLKTMERKAVIQAEHARENAAAAAWWLVISALVSAGAAIGGSLIAMG